MFKKLYKRLLPGLLALTLVVTTGCGMGTALAKFFHHAEVATLKLTIGDDIVTLVDGKAFATAIENATKVTFGLFEDNAYGFNWDDSEYENVSTDAVNKPIRLFKSGTEYFVLSAIKIVANEDCSGMFASNSANKSTLERIIDFDKVNTSSATNMSGMFENSVKLENINDVLLKLDTSSLENMSSMFAGLTTVTSLDLSNFETASVTNMSKMFNTCENLTTIYVSEKWTTENVTESGNMFQKCNNIVGGNGTGLTKNAYDKTYARIDRPGTPGYLTEKTTTNAAIYASRPNVMPEGSTGLTPPEQEVIQTFTINTSDLHGAYIAEIAAGKTTWNVGEDVVLTLRISDGLNQLPTNIYINVDGTEYTIQTTRNMIGSNINSTGGITYNTETYQLIIPASMTTGNIAISAYV